MKKKKIESTRDFKDRIAAQIRGVSVETYVLTRKLNQAEKFEKYKKMVTSKKAPMWKGRKKK